MRQQTHVTPNSLLDMFPSEIEEQLADGNDIAIISIGSLEQHGPHLLLGTDGYFSEALAQEIGRQSGGMVLPPVPFSWVGCTNAFPGGIGVRESVFIAYLREVVKGLWKSGFRCIVVVNGHGGNFYALRSFPNDLFKEEGIPVLCVYGLGGCKEAQQIEREAGGEAAGLAGGLRLLGREDLVETVQEQNHAAIAEFGDRPRVQFEPRSMRESRRLGVVGHDYSHECLHVQPASQLDVEAGAEGIRVAAEYIGSMMEDLRAYVATQ